MRCSYAAESGVEFVVHENFIASDDCPPAYAENVTLVTHATYGFLRHVAELCDRWQGPLSVAVFAPGTDLDEALAWIDFLRRCGRNPCVRRSVTWHLVYDREHTPASLKPETSGSSYSTDASGNRSCSSVPAQEDVSSFRRRKRIPYPINVLRNVARRLAPTNYVLVQNVRLYPSTGIVPRFLSLVAEERRLHSFRSDGQEVYVLPVFAMTARAGDPQVQQKPPRSMRELRESLRSEAVVPLNDSSHGGELWWSSFYSALMNASSEPWTGVKEERLRVQTTVKRDKGVLLWEPVFLGTRDDPTYGESFTWEGGRERVSQGYTMCLENYDFHMLEDAFLVRVPEPTGGAGAVVRTGSGDPSRQNVFHLHRFRDSLGSRYPVERSAFC
ncbi:beta-1,4-glucuronyltransferase 1 [Dermacentor silvarum]|uniref:beta-1,4-glucuronyltransferase 1 n=1 Tax=Dermacentor silvarum TaxID=543639 RepID=UPI00189AA37F|nr:beta-1,4-glucuronyltransferase 1 [Dermacentor silvarum]